MSNSHPSAGETVEMGGSFRFLASQPILIIKLQVSEKIHFKKQKQKQKPRQMAPEEQHSSLTSGLHTHTKEPPNEPSYPSDPMIVSFGLSFGSSHCGTRKGQSWLSINHRIKIPEVTPEQDAIKHKPTSSALHFEPAASLKVQGHTIAVEF